MRFPVAIKWVGTFVLLLLAVAWVYSARRAIQWDSRDARHEVLLIAGDLAVAWRPDGWSLAQEEYPPTGGWNAGIHHWEGWLQNAWVHRSCNKSWCCLAVPLWIPMALVGLPVVVLWYAQRRSTAESLIQFVRWWTPDRRQRMTLRLVAFICIPLFLLTLTLSSCVREAVNFFSQANDSGTMDYTYRPDSLDFVTIVFLLSTPFWAILLASAFVHFRNHLFRSRPEPLCGNCGYNLTGNVSGVCPECGAAVEAVSKV